jgi:glucose/arabinose dehydrogenase
MNHMQSPKKHAATESLFGQALKSFAHICAAVALLATALAPAVAAPKANQWSNLVSDIATVAPTSLNVAPTNDRPPLPLIRQGSIEVGLVTVASGLTAPLELTSPADGTGRLFIVQQTGQILILQSGSILPTPFLDVSSRLVPLMPDYDERGLLGFAFHPDFNNASAPGYHKIYTYTSEPVDGPADFTVPNPSPFDNQSVLAEWQVSATDPNVIDPSTRREVVRIDHPQFNHDGGKLAFRATDRYLYISLGDGGNANDVGDGHTAVKGNGQDKTNVLGKVLRINPLDPALTRGSGDRVSANGKYRIPRTNPFLAQPGAVDEIFLYGLRNPYRFSFDSTLDHLIIADVGQNNIEEVDLGVSGSNYGWHRKEGTFLFNPDTGSIRPDQNPDPRLVNPVAEYSHFDGIAVVGGFTYRGTLVPLLANRYIFGDLSGNAGSARLFYTYLGNSPILEFQMGPQNPLEGQSLKGFGQDDANELYVMIDSNIGPSGTGGKVLKIVEAQNQP